MILEVLVEERSAAVALEQLIPRIVPGVRIGADVFIHPFSGKQDLLKKLPARLRGYSTFDDARIVVLVDRDREDCRALKKQIVADARRAGVARRVLSRIAIEELEAWFLGDVPALRTVFPRIPASLGEQASFREPDAIVGAAEALARVIENAGGGKPGKVDVARRVAAAMHIDDNRSRSFQAFRDGLRRHAA